MIGREYLSFFVGDGGWFGGKEEENFLVFPS